MTAPTPALEPAPFTSAYYAKNTPDRLAMVCGDTRWTWAEYYERVCRAGQMLHGLGVHAGQRAAVLLHNCVEWWEVTQALGKLKANAVPIGYRLKAPEVEYIINNSESATVVYGVEFSDMMRDLQRHCPQVPERRWICVGGAPLPGGTPYEAALAAASTHDPETDRETSSSTIIYTSGTTGRPKGAFRKNRKRELQAQFGMSAIETFKLSSDDVHLVCCPLYHSAPPAMAGLDLMLGATVVHLPKFTPEAFCATVQAHGVTTTFLVPTQANRLVALPDAFFQDYDLSSLRTVIVAGAPCHQSTKERLLDLLGPVLYEFYGSTECAINTVMRPEDHLRKPGSCGAVFPGNEIKLLDESGHEVPTGEIGELFIRNAFLIDEYYHNEDATKDAFRDGWMSVGDMARVDEHGFYYIVDRKKDMVISGGVNIYPAEIEDALQHHPAIFEAAVIGIPDPDWGESLKAFIVRRQGHTLTEDDVLRYCEEQMADYKKPRSIVFLDELPRNPSGKLMKRDLRDRYWAGHERRVL